MPSSAAARDLSSLESPSPTSALQRGALEAASDRIWRAGQQLTKQGTPLDVQAFAETLVDEMYDLVQAPCSIFRVAPTERGWTPEFFAARGLRPAALAQYQRDLESHSASVLLHDPLFPRLESRNVVETISTPESAEVLADAPASVRQIVGPTGLTRLLVCDGPLLLATMNVFRAHGPRLDAQVLGQLSRPARVVLRAARCLSVRRLGPILETLLVSYPGEAYVLCQDGTVEIANELGSRRIRERGKSLVQELGQLAQGYPTAPSGWELQPVRQRGQPLLLVALRAETPAHDLETRLALASRRWNLTPRHVEVIRSLAVGHSNKELALALGVSLRTAEQHVADVLVRTQAESRLQLVAKLWREA